MPNTLRRLVPLLLLVLGVASATWAQAPCQAEGDVFDEQGNPVADAVVIFRARANSANDYRGKTSKKGRYFIDGMYTPKEDDRWDISIEAPGWLPVEVTIENRTVNRVLVGEVLKTKLKPGQSIPDIPIRPLGKVKVDFVVGPEADVRSRQPGAATPAATDLPGGQPQGQPSDPWIEAIALANAGDLDQSLEFFAKAAEAKPDVERYETWAKVLYQLEKWDEAERQARKAIELGPDLTGPRLVLASVLVRRQKLEDASRVLHEAQAQAPEDQRVLEQMAWVAGELGAHADAVVAYEAITRVSPGNVQAWMALGDLYTKLGQADRSREAYQKVVELNPGEAYQTFYNLGALLMNKKDRSETDTQRAVEAFRKAVEIKPDYAAAQQQLGFALLGMGDRAGARSALEAYVRLKPNAADAGQMKAILESLH